MATTPENTYQDQARAASVQPSASTATMGTSYQPDREAIVRPGGETSGQAQMSPNLNLGPQSSVYDPGQNASYNPTAVNASNKTFGSEDSKQFMIEPFMQPFNFGAQKGENQSYNEQFTNFLAGLETPEATRQRLENRYGYQDAQENYLRTQEQASDVMNAARSTRENVQSRSRNTVVTQAQLDNIVNVEVKGLMETYSRLGELNEQQGRRLALIEQNMNQAAQLEMAQQQKMMTPWLQQYNDKNIMQAREYSGWTFANQLELNRLMANQQAGFNWTNAEATRAHELSMQENAFNNSVKLLEKQNEMAMEYF